jgi:hypothetical protein
MVVDVIAVPFTSFDMTGLSQRADRRRELLRENAGVVRRHWWTLAQGSMAMVCRLGANLLRAFRRW